MLRSLVIRVALGLTLVAGIGFASIAPALAGGVAGPIIPAEGKQPVPGGSTPIQPRIAGITNILGDFTKPTGKGSGGGWFNNAPDGSHVPNAGYPDGQFAKSRTGSGGTTYPIRIDRPGPSIQLTIVARQDGFRTGL